MKNILLLSALFFALGLKAQNVKLITSTADRTKVFETGKTKAAKSATGMVVKLDPTVAFQTMDGFGAAVTGSTCYNLLRMEEKDRNDFLVKTFSHKKGLGFSYIRISIGCSDFSLNEYTCCDEKGIENFRLSWEDTDYVIPVLREILHINPDIKILGSPWTCPRWMKVNNLEELKPFNSWTSGQLNPKHYADYAEYFVRWVKAYEELGVPIHAVTVQNEPLNRGNSASLFMGWKEQQTFVGKHLGPAFKQAQIKAKIYAFDHNYNYDNMPDQQQYPLHIYEDEEAAAFLTGAAYHDYGGHQKELLRIGAERPDKELIFTETSIGMWNDGRNLSKRLNSEMSYLGLGSVNNGCKAVMVWNLMLDTDRGPYRPGGCSTCYGAVDIDRKDFKTITYNSHYYTMGHLACVVKPGAKRIEVSTAAPINDLNYSAFKNADGTTAFVVSNGTAKPVQLSIPTEEGKYINLNVPAHAVCSARW